VSNSDKVFGVRGVLGSGFRGASLRGTLDPSLLGAGG
jgi:hypothetical protein